jgi:TonB family protein
MNTGFLYICLLSISALFAQESPAFKGGQRALTSFITNNLIYPEYSKANCLQGTVQVSFKLDRRGMIYESEISSGFGTDIDREALRIVRLSSGKWTVPAGYDTLSNLVLPVNFTLRDFECDRKSRDEINAAISAYQARQGLSAAIFNFYDKKSQGIYDPAAEAGIIDLKAQLGYDERFIDRLLKQAQRKLKQGDQEGACEDFQTIRLLGSDKSAAFIERNCK